MKEERYEIRYFYIDLSYPGEKDWNYHQLEFAGTLTECREYAEAANLLWIWADGTAYPFNGYCVSMKNFPSSEYLRYVIVKAVKSPAWG